MKKPNWKKWNKKLVLLAALNFVLLVVLVVLLISFQQQTNALHHEQAAARWRGQSEERFTQVSCYLPSTSSMTAEDVVALRRNLDTKLLEASLTAPETGSLFVDAYSAEGTIMLSQGRNSVTVKAIGVGGDFFFFHPFRLRSGSYLAPDDLMKDRVVLDEDTAWRLFGSYDVAGLEVLISGTPYLVAGVIQHDQDDATQLARQNEPCIFVDYSLLAPQSNITCYELAIADPITGFGKLMLEDLIYDPQKILVENSNRYNLEHLIDLRLSYAEQTMRRSSISYPYWENAALYSEAKASQLLVAIAIFGIIPLATVIGILIHYGRKLQRRIAKAIDDRRIQA